MTDTSTKYLKWKCRHCNTECSSIYPNTCSNCVLRLIDEDEKNNWRKIRYITYMVTFIAVPLTVIGWKFGFEAEVIAIIYEIYLNKLLPWIINNCMRWL